ncbi:hypothetical protein [Aliivibrio fischeri]|uniref:hypothetical protein n=1 Tax=Aliivibrio fischeri TaxID=668 RepID=UPI00080E17C4|nr:hypothetical protein [Aliivibrio fischeri]OCH02157.1 hypothetical protein A6E09_18565 [Aliivibrio fischeri]
MKENWPLCGRVVFLSGGQRAVIEPQSDVIMLWPKTKNGKIDEIKIDKFEKLYSALKAYNLKIIGVEFTTHYSEFIGEAPKQFRGYTEQDANWPNWDAAQKWGELALSSFHNKDGLSYDLSNRIRFQLDTINNRLRSLLLSYQNQLNALVLKDNFKADQRFQDGYTDLVYQEFHSFLFDAGILRDNLCEYIYNFSNNGSRKSDIKVTTASGLFKCLKKIDDLTKLESYLKSEMSKDGWLFELGQYRDLVMHSAPINIASHRLFAIHEPITLPNGKESFSVRFPLPSNPSKLYSERCKRDDFDKYIEQFEAYSRISLEDRGKYDCLEYAHKVFGLLSNLSLEVSKESSLKPMRQTFIRTNSGTISKPVYVEES